MGKKILAFFLLFISFVGLAGGIGYLFYYGEPAIAVMQIVVAFIYCREYFPRWWNTLNR